jgi:predicted peptidase
MQKKLKFRTRVTRKISLNYLLYLPKDYKPAGEKLWPLMLFLHRAGERGANLTLVTKHGPPKLAAQKKEFPFIIVSPQCPLEQTWNDEALLALLDHVIARFKVDARRIYLTGLSMGGYGTWSLGMKHPERFAAIVPVCGGGNAGDILLVSRNKKHALQTLAVWAFHGAKDDVVPLAESKVMFVALKKAGCKKVKLAVYPDTGHDSYTKTYNNPKLYEWLLKHRRKLKPRSHGCQSAYSFKK